MDNFDLEFGMLTQVASAFHSQQTRKGKDEDEHGLRMPYIVHPLQVLRRLQAWGITARTELNKSLWKALLFHDSVEDTCMTYEYLVGLIGRLAADIVMELSHRPGEDKKLFMASFGTKSIDSLVGKIADRLENVEDFILDSPGYAKKYFHKADHVFQTFEARYEEVVERFGKETAERIAEDIKSTALRLSNLKW